MSLLSVAVLTFFAALATLAAILGTQIYFSHQRRKRFHSLELTPNILMTRFPLLFIGRNRSLFRLAGDFLELPAYLQEHGYQVEEIEIAIEMAVEMTDLHSRRQTLQRILAAAQSPVHMIVCDALCETAYDVALEGNPKLATLTLLGRTPNRDRRIGLKPPKSPIFERPELRPCQRANSFATEQIALQHMVSLAEHDLR